MSQQLDPRQGDPGTYPAFHANGNLQASDENLEPEVNSLEYHVRHWARHPEPEIISTEYRARCWDRTTTITRPLTCRRVRPDARDRSCRHYLISAEHRPTTGFTGPSCRGISRYRDQSAHFTAPRTTDLDQAFSASAGQAGSASG